jgi:hypothetical protein
MTSLSQGHNYGIIISVPHQHTTSVYHRVSFAGGQETPYKSIQEVGPGDMPQVVEHLPSKCKAPSSQPYIPKEK